MPMAYFRFALRSRSPYRNSMAYFHFVHRPLIPMFHSIFAWKRMYRSFWYSLHLKIYAFYCSFANYGLFFLVNKDTSGKINTPEDTVGYHVFVSLKALNTKCWDPFLVVSYHKCVRKISHKNEYRKRNRPISDGFLRTSKSDDLY